MNLAFDVFVIASLVVGVIVLFAALLVAAAYAVNTIMEYRGVWRVYMLAVSIRMHGKDHADNQFWWAIKERARKSDWAAKMIANYAMEHAPKEDSDNG